MDIDETLLSRARELAFARRENIQVAELPREALGEEDLSIAYALQAEAIRAYNEPVIGWKLGATSRVAQEIMQTDAPFYGPLFQSAIHASGADVTLPPGLFGFEVEVAFTLGRDLPATDRPYAAADVEAAVASVHPAIEVVAWRQLLHAMPDAVLAVPDFGINHALILGEGVADWRLLDLVAAKSFCLVNGVDAAEGLGGDALGGPLQALAWLADNGPGLKEGDVVSTGTITGLAPAKPGDEVKGRIEGLGEVVLRALHA